MATGAERAVDRRAPARRPLNRLADELLRPSPPAVVSGRTAAMAGAAVVVGAAVAVARQQGPGALDTVWAEDGTVFLAQAHDLGIPGSVLEPYAGYLHVVPRAIAALASALPLEHADTVFAAVSAAVTAALALFVFRASSAHVTTRWARLACAVPLLVSPLAGTEVLANAANLHWFLLYAAFWAAVWVPPSRWETAAAAAVLGAAVLSDPFALVLLPLVALRLVARGGRPDFLAAAFAATAVVQLAGVASAGSGRQLGEKAEIPLLPFRYVVDVLGRGLVGDRFVGESGLSARGVAVGAACVLLVGALVYVRRGVIGRRAELLGAMLIASVCYFVAPVALSGISTPRYGLAPALLVTAALAVLVDGTGTGERRAGGTLVAVVTACWLVGLPSYNQRDEGPTWDEALTAAAACAPGEDTTVAVLPVGLTSALPCEDVVRAAGR